MTLINDHFAVAKDEYLIAVYPETKKAEPASGTAGSSSKAVTLADFQHDQEISNTFKSLVWSQHIRALGKAIWDLWRNSEIIYTYFV